MRPMVQRERIGNPGRVHIVIIVIRGRRITGVNSPEPSAFSVI